MEVSTSKVLLSKHQKQSEIEDVYGTCYSAKIHCAQNSDN